VRALVRKVGALAQTSANTHGNPAATKASEIEDRLFELADLVVDGGVSRIGAASTIVDCTKGKPEILREGAITGADIEEALA
jgi:L-threonylcarbamoyladenylate synthase